MRWLMALMGAAACGNAVTAPASVGEQPTDAVAPKSPGEMHADKVADDPLFPERKAGWEHLDEAGARAADELAEQYIAYASAAKTPRRAVSALIELAIDAGAAELAADRIAAVPGAMHCWTRVGRDAGVIVRTGKKPITDGMRVIVASVDAPRIDLKQTPVYDEAGLTMFDTFFYGDVDWKSWLVTPMALHVYAARPGSSSGDVDLVIGEAETDPVLSIPDLLPHLSGKAQRKQVVDSPERLDAIAAGSRAALDTFLSSQGIDVRTFEDAEVYLLPAGPAVFVGVDRGLIAGYGHSHRALAFAATRALLAEEAPEYTSAVILISNSEIGTGASGPAFIQTALSRVLGALSKDGSDTDVLDTRRAYARSAVLMSARIEAAERNKGIAMNTRADDALPDATRRAIDRMTSTGAQVQVTFDKSWQSQTRKLAALDMDAVGIGLPTTGHGTPMELISVLDLYSGHLALRGWMTAK